MEVIQRDDRGWKVKTRFLTFHPVSYGVGTLSRLAIGSPTGRAVMLHYFPRHTPGPDMHDHPWPFTTVILWGHYTDVSITPAGVVREELRTGMVRRRQAAHRHRTIVHRPTFTIVFRGRVERTWCEGTPEDWKCEGRAEDFNETLGMVTR